MSNKENDGWMQWNGGNNPVHNSIHVDIEFRNGRIELDRKSTDVHWGFGIGGFDVIKYRVNKKHIPCNKDYNCDYLDAQRYRWLKRRYLGCDFLYRDRQESVLLFEFNSSFIAKDISCMIDDAILREAKNNSDK